MKKIISIILSALMVVSVLPSFAMTAMADDKKVGIVAEYFVDSDLSKDYTGNGRTMTSMGNVAWWNNNEDYYKDSHTGAYFSGKDSYATKYDALKNAGITVENGFSISFYGFKYATGNWRRFIDLCNGTDSYTFITTSGMVGIKEPGTGDKTNRSGSETADRTWNKYLLSCDSTGAKVYRDGVLIAQQSYENNTAWLNAMISTADLQVGLSAYSADEKLDGIIRELRIYDTACTPDEIEAASVENYKANRISRGIPEIFNSVAYHGPTAAEGAYSNVVWHAADQTAWGDEGNNVAGFKYNKIDMPNNLVLAYDGVNDVAQPVVFEWRTDGDSYMKTLFPRNNNPDLTEFRSYWHGWTDADWNAFNYVGANEIVGYAPYQDMETEKLNNKDTKRFMYNKLYYKGTGNTDTYYDKIQNLEFDLYAKKGNGSYGDNARYSKGLSYVINYKPIYDILATKDYATILANEAKYTADSFAAFKTAVENVVMLDVNGYFANETGSTVEANVIAAANAIKTTANAYNTAKANLQCAHSNYIKTTVDNVDTYTCDFCSDSYTVDKQALAAAITVAETEMAQSYYETKYTSASKFDFENALAEAKAALTANNSIDDVNAATTNLQTKQSELKVQKYNVTINIIDENGTDIYDVERNGYGEYEYGSLAYLNVSIPQITEGRYLGHDKYLVYKWTKTINGADISLGTNARELCEVITADTTYNCYLLDFDAAGVENSKTRVRYIDKSNNTVGFDYAEMGTEIYPSWDAPEIPFYEFAGWECVFGNPSCVDLQEVVFKATYTYSDVEANKLTIVGLGDVKVGSETTSQYVAYYDELVNLYGAEKYAYATEDGTVIAPVAGSQIYAPHNSNTIYIVALENEAKASTMITGHILETGKLTLNVQSFVPEGATLVETGIVASKTSYDPTIGAAGCSKAMATNVGSKGEFSMVMGFTKTGTVHFKSYLTYNDSTGTHTVYSGVYDVTL